MLFESIDGLLEALGENFHGSTPEARARDGYMFRGHSNSKWLLQPTILRDPRTVQRVKARDFYTRAFLRDLKLARSSLNLPGDDELPLFAVAQHYGFPTTLLDFSYSFEVAAAFAHDNTSAAEFGVVFQLSRTEVENLANPFGAIGLTKAATDAIFARVGLSSVPPLEIVSLPTVKRVTVQEGLFFSLRPDQVTALERDCIDRYYFRHSAEPNRRLSALYATLFPADDLLDEFVRDWTSRSPYSEEPWHRGETEA
jgi:hypothetical protein